MRRPPSRLLLIAGTLLAAVLATCMCLAAVLPGELHTRASEAFLDYLWTCRTKSALASMGYTVHAVSVLGAEPPGEFRSLDVQIGNLRNGEERPLLDVVFDVTSALVSTYHVPRFRSEPVDIVSIMVIDYDEGSHFIGVSFQAMLDFQGGSMDREDYVRRLSYSRGRGQEVPPW